MYPFPTYTLPDGTKTYYKPKDGQVFTTNDGEHWMYDGLYEQWLRKRSIPKRDDDPVHPDFEQDMALAKKQGPCECGAAKVGSPKHSSWCCKYDPKQ